MTEIKSDNNPNRAKSKKEQWQEDMSVQKNRVKDISEDKRMYLVVFNLSKEWYGTKIEDVKEIIKVPRIFAVPQVLEYILGVTNIRGEIIPVIDLRKLFSTPVSDLSGEARVLIVENNKVKIGLLVDSVSEVIDIQMSHIDSPLSTLDRVKSEFIYGEIKISEASSSDEKEETSGRFLAIIHLENIIKDILTVRK
ncbi:MAG: chemotaxis protein CheW [bacterium]|nr:chemotaxis protein CheW [bacterium]